MTGSRRPPPMPPDGLPPVVYEDEAVIVVDKPAGLLSQPGRLVADSVHRRVVAARPGIEGPAIVHRLDCDTSGLMMLAKSAEVHRRLSRAFRERAVHKRYVAIVTGRVEAEAGVIALPLRADLDDRPRQIVCHRFGKPSETRWRRLGAEGGNNTRLELEPLTGRSHQLRVHLADAEGLGRPIVGDPLYGVIDDAGPVEGTRMYLHAAGLEFTHPLTGEACRLACSVPF